MILPGAASDQAAAKLEQVLEAVRNLRVLFDGNTLSVTISAGGWCGPSSIDFDRALGLADSALYQAKSEGRDRLVMRVEDPI